MQAKGGSGDTERIHQAAAEGTAGAGTTLPYVDQIQRSFGRHDVTGVQAHTDSRAARSARAIGAEAFAMGEHVAFAGTPTLATAAHEAAHIVQQRSGVQLKGGVGEESDRYEQHADAVAALVVRGASAEALLDEHAGPARASASAPQTQRSPVQRLISIRPEHFARGLGVDLEHLTRAQLNEYFNIAVWDEVQHAMQLAKFHKNSEVRSGIRERMAAIKETSSPQEKLPLVYELIELVNGFTQENDQVYEEGYEADGGGAVIPRPERSTRYATKPEGGYSHTDLNTGKPEKGKWGDDEAMWSQFAEGVGPGVAEGAYETAEPGSKKKKLLPLQQLPWGEAKRLLPRPLINLIFDVRYQLETNGEVVIDQRTPSQQARKDKSPNEPGTLRSWHQDSHGVLPSTSIEDGVPDHAGALHDHYNDTSQTGAGSSIGKGVDGPQGLAEYTGTGSNWEHNTKIVLDYAQKRVYLTLTHYQYWALLERNGTFEFFGCKGQNKDLAEGELERAEREGKLEGVEQTILMSPWMEILMPTADTLGKPSKTKSKGKGTSTSTSTSTDEKSSKEEEDAPEEKPIEKLEKKIDTSSSSRIEPTPSNQSHAKDIIERTGAKPRRRPDRSEQRKPQPKMSMDKREATTALRNNTGALSPTLLGAMLVAVLGVVVAILYMMFGV